MILDFKIPFKQGYEETIMKGSKEWKLKDKAANTSK